MVMNFKFLFLRTEWIYCVNITKLRCSYNNTLIIIIMSVAVMF